MGGGRFRPLLLKDGQSDLWIGLPPGADGAAALAMADEELRRLRADLGAWMLEHPDFESSLGPLDEDAGAPPLAAAMLAAGRAAGVGPMAAVAGAIAQSLGEYLCAGLGLKELIIENGGDLWIRTEEELAVGIYAGLSSLSGKLGIQLPAGSCLGLCSSSGKVGPSLSFGKADVLSVACTDAALADAYATAFGNRVRRDDDLAPAVEEAARSPGVLFALGIRAGRLACAGDVRLRPLGPGALGQDA